MKDANFLIPKPSLLQEAVSIIDELRVPIQNKEYRGRYLRISSLSTQDGRYEWPVPHSQAHHPDDD